MNTITYDQAMYQVHEDAIEMNQDPEWAASIDALPEIVRTIHAFLSNDDGGYLNNYGLPSVHHAMNAYHFYGMGDNVIDRTIAGCESYMREGWDDYFDLIDTAKILAIFTWAKSNM